MEHKRHGFLAKTVCNLSLPILVLKSNAGFYIGTVDEEGPVSRESVEYFPCKELAQSALERGNWTQRQTP